MLPEKVILTIKSSEHHLLEAIELPLQILKTCNKTSSLKEESCETPKYHNFTKLEIIKG